LSRKPNLDTISKKVWVHRPTLLRLLGVGGVIRPGLDILKGEMQCLKYPDQKHMYGNATRRRRS